MKTLGRILIILTVFVALSGLMVAVVNTSGSNAPDFDGAPQFRPSGDSDGVRPEGGDHNQPVRGERGGLGGGSRWMFGLVKNIGVMAMLVVLIALPKSLAKKKKRKQAMPIL